MNGRQFFPPNALIHWAAVNDVDFRNRAARGYVCNGFSCSIVAKRFEPHLGLDCIIWISIGDDKDLPIFTTHRYTKNLLNSIPKMFELGLRFSIFGEEWRHCLEVNPDRAVRPFLDHRLATGIESDDFDFLDQRWLAGDGIRR